MMSKMPDKRVTSGVDVPDVAVLDIEGPDSHRRIWDAIRLAERYAHRGATELQPQDVGAADALRQDVCPDQGALPS